MIGIHDVHSVQILMFSALLQRDSWTIEEILEMIHRPNRVMVRRKQIVDIVDFTLKRVKIDM